MTTATKINVGIIGASGYTGLELMRLLFLHPYVTLTRVVSREHAGKRVSDVFPHLFLMNQCFSGLDLKDIALACEVVFLCMPHHEAMNTASFLRTHGVKVIDLSADFRFNNLKTYEKIYGAHSQPQLNEEAIYGLCELNREKLARSFLTAVPGCYVTSILLALLPLIQEQLIVTDDIICDSKSGISGAGRSAKVDNLMAERAGDFSAYGIGNHRHRPEIEEKLSDVIGKPVSIIFTPHLLPITRGILSTCYVKPLRQMTLEAWHALLTQAYQDHPFVHVLPIGQSPRIKSVVGTNFCHVSVHLDADQSRLILVSALDNLLKGASGQAVQCFNLMSGFEETLGLTAQAIYP